jgi:hypothetical protein
LSRLSLPSTHLSTSNSVVWLVDDEPSGWSTPRLFPQPHSAINLDDEQPERDPLSSWLLQERFDSPYTNSSLQIAVLWQASLRLSNTTNPGAKKAILVARLDGIRSCSLVIVATMKDVLFSMV